MPNALFAPVVINLLGFKVNTMDRNSILSFSPVQQNDIFLSTKRNQGFGELNGDCSPPLLPVNGVADPNINESNAIKGSIA